MVTPVSAEWSPETTRHSRAQNSRAQNAADVVGTVVDPEMPMLTLADLGVVRSVEVCDGDRAVTVTITPTYSGCPALEEMRADLRTALADAGYRQVEVRTVFSPPWSTDWITEDGRRKLAEAGVAPPGRVSAPAAGPIPLTLDPPSSSAVRCPHCGAPATEELSRFGPTACTELRRCPACREPFEHMKEI
ncbi:MAG: ring,2-phenylacetyl-CoA epoxidase subunit PaaD [Pseudonocardiales bacterium]|nr:ring,2-phenylacetyl-CoA epoxidase subunit PaaD [Pseudonocardiales bacterium]MDT7672665.1 ring,2-phenylacetyl-CoA epoxidase subunit PaaD [Pseudonocardiales bacterium]MDT7696804.1 ring,2-phenylacetyl-CoA epoxidase subunit PaaD [Pseudonocardiales bacterium]